ncbi:PREDICTED: uncharacterized protein LOC109588387 isoform X2 [Amphimedon queenslandica]|uniref:Uncharacterized protein n=1 Tax=Amphimedon queenslandica TaxID=400682 RepID=A0AAN0JT93_AMPQE|nr:PREDICTED: uncharacterized protein LOC109588387 isoform X2 [Amphimedon queenslandica]|eukprot:XP_019860119.1 PREDICTED: uncharacterized protein LOC109588387 isoform X2 [Amphimedon queenslandica]
MATNCQIETCQSAKFTKLLPPILPALHYPSISAGPSSNVTVSVDLWIVQWWYYSSIRNSSSYQTLTSQEKVLKSMVSVLFLKRSQEKSPLLLYLVTVALLMIAITCYLVVLISLLDCGTSSKEYCSTLLQFMVGGQ